jgi:two-component system, sporulation sensor kinase E
MWMERKVPYYITESKNACKERGMKPSDISVPKTFMTDRELLIKRKSYSEILSVVSFFSKKLLDSLKGTPILISITDADGHLLDTVGDESIKSMTEGLGVKEGCRFTEAEAGTNVISLTLQQRHPICLLGDDHYHTFLHELACYGAPFHYTDEDNLLGSVCIMMPLVFHNPLIVTMLTQVVDSIERELLLRKQNKKLNILNQIMLSRAKSGILITDNKGTITEVNDFALKIINHTIWSSSEKNICADFLTGTYFQQVLEQHVKFENIELTLNNNGNEPIVFLFDALPIYEEDKVVGAFGQFRDITDRYMIEEKIKEAEKQALAGRIAAGIAHEIRNPLTTVRGYLQFLDHDVEKKTSNIFSSLLIPEIDRANKIITDFLSIAKPSFKNPEVIKVQHLVTDYLWHFLESESFLYNVEINIVIDPETKDLAIQCNREELLQVFINLFQNSLQAKGGEPLKINISTCLVNSQIQFIFNDNGNGIDPTVLSHIFDPFFTTKDIGTGLGLSISRKIVENHKGTMQASSNCDGTTFIIELPIYNEGK